MVKMPRRPLLALLAALASRLELVSGFYYLILEPGTNEQCLLVEQPQSTLVDVSYEFPSYATQNVKLTVNLGITTSSAPVSEHAIKNDKGSFQFVAVKNGMHSVCIVSEGVSKRTKIGLDIKYGQADTYYDELKKEAHLDALEATIMKLYSQMAQIISEADYMKDREVVFHQQCERMNAAAKWWPILQVTILLITGVLQVRNLKRYFKSKKLF